MSKTILAEYDAENNTLKLDEALEGVGDREKVRIAVEPDTSEATAGREPERPWMVLEGSLPVEAAEELRTILLEAAAPDPHEV